MSNILTCITIPEHDPDDIWMRRHIEALKVRGGREIVLYAEYWIDGAPIWFTNRDEN